MNYLITTIIAAPAVFLAYAYWQLLRQRRAIREQLTSQGCSAFGFAFTDDFKQHHVTYISEAGDKRVATFSRQLPIVRLTDRGYHEELQDNYAKSDSMIEWLVMLVDKNELPGRRPFTDICVALINREIDTAILIEGDDAGDNLPRFAPVLQFVEMASFADPHAADWDKAFSQVDPLYISPRRSTGKRPNVLEMTYQGKDVDIYYRVEGSTPRRTLTLSLSPPA